MLGYSLLGAAFREVTRLEREVRPILHAGYYIGDPKVHISYGSSSRSQNIAALPDTATV